jgi:simple sugar transport system ATP-binding protein
MRSLVEMKGIVKKFPGVVANDHIDFELKKGEIHTLLGENGSGKTTLMNILYGMYHSDEGKILLNGEQVNIETPKDAIALGIGMVHQHFMLIHAHTVIENIILGYKSEKEPLLDTANAIQKVNDLSKKYSLRTDPNAPVWQ